MKLVLVITALMAGFCGSLANADDGLCAQMLGHYNRLVERNFNNIEHNNQWIRRYLYDEGNQESANYLMELNKQKFGEVETARARLDSICGN